MKKSVKILIAAAVCIVILGVSLFVYGNSFDRIDADQVEQVLFENHNMKESLSEEETAEFIELFNKASLFSRCEWKENGIVLCKQ